MRPIRRGAPPHAHDYDDYREAFGALVSRLGAYCSFCERRIATNLAVEHIEPKNGPHGQPQLIGRWSNFLLACVNCNSTKGARKVDLADVLLPDRDNTFIAIEYTADGLARPNPATSAAVRDQAQALLALAGLHRRGDETLDEDDKVVALDRVAQRKEAMLTARMARDLIAGDPSNVALRDIAAHLASASGFFSIWMQVFEGDADQRSRLVDAFRAGVDPTSAAYLGARASGCFDANGAAVSPAPNPDGLPHGGRI